MYKKRRKTSGGLKALLVVAFIFFALFAGAFVWLGFAGMKSADPDLEGPLAVLLYSLNSVMEVVTFSLRGVPSIVYYILCGVAYLFAGLALIFIIVNIIVGATKRRRIVIPSIILSLLMAFAAYVVVTLYDKLWMLIFKPFNFPGFPALDDLFLMIASILLAVLAVVFIILSLVAFGKTISEARKNPRVLVDENAEAVMAENAPQEESVEFEALPDEPTPEFVPLAEPAKEEQPAPAPIAAGPATQIFINTQPPATVAPQPEPQPAPAPQPAPQPAPAAKEEKEDKEDLKSLLREIVRDIVRDEIARNNANQAKNDFNPLAGGTITGATFGGPLVVQYFNGGINSPQPEPQPAPQPEAKPEPQPQPAQEEREPQPESEQECEPEPQPEPEPEPIPEPAPQQEVVPAPIAKPVPAPQEEATEEKKPIIRIPFTERMLNADDEMKKNYNELKNEILSYGVNSRVSNSGDTFRLHRKTYVKITIAGLSLKLYFALNPEDYKDSTLPIQNAGHKGIYAEIPLVFKVKSGLSMRRCKELIQDVMDKNGLEQGEVRDIDWVEELKLAPQNDGDDE